jgi:hypothetical protein
MSSPTHGTEHNERIGVADKELHKAAEDHEKTTNEYKHSPRTQSQSCLFVIHKWLQELAYKNAAPVPSESIHPNSEHESGDKLSTKPITALIYC